MKVSWRILIFWAGIFLVGALYLGFYLSERIESYQRKSTALQEEGTALIGGDFGLWDVDGRHVTPQQFLGRYMLVYFGYSFCPDICPTGLENMTEALEKLGPLAKRVQPIFITVDPKRDTAKVLSKFMGDFHPSFVALTGTKNQVKEAMKVYRVYAQRVGKEQSDFYLMDHSSIVYLMGPDGKFITHFTHQTPGEKMAIEITEIMKKGALNVR